MFNIDRSIHSVPDCLSRKEYNHPEVISKLKDIFHGKCYLCERNAIQDLNVEHLIPHEGNELLKYDWNNLFYSCRRCNSLKSNGYKNILDCSDSALNVFLKIKCKMPSIPDDEVRVERNQEIAETEPITETIQLLHECYNSNNTGNREVSREALMDDMFEFYWKFLEARKVLKDPSEGKSKKQEAEERIEAMLHVSHPFAVFWRWHYLEDSFLVSNYPTLRDSFL